MPNHCTNEVTINFKDLEQKEAFRKWVDNGDDNPLDFERILPYPKGIETVTDILSGKKKKVVVFRKLGNKMEFLQLGRF
mgnify:CR=1 FL=1